ncbi:hypothetical protein PanWU01x14_209710 [Parasponia andersonii]|uniref:Uncharacterized protein n=1 Tax=Parasponia andersonii TaxID=3476 RepID=A0A2P5BUA3_PARAD|nr:hypothetical protein PanWU01x14_209710 [Parasponia andersonii]
MHGCKINNLKPAYVEILPDKSSKPLVEGFNLRIHANESNTEVDQTFDPFRPEQAEGPSQGSSQIVANQEDLVDTEMVQKANKVTNEVDGSVRCRRRRRIGVAIAAKIGAMHR